LHIVVLKTVKVTSRQTKFHCHEIFLQKS